MRCCSLSVALSSCLVQLLLGGLGRAAAADAAATKNPFRGQHFYLNPVNAREFDSSISTATGSVRRNLQKMQSVPSAYWIDRKAKIRGSDTTTVEGILKDAAAKPTLQLVVLMWYDLPNRDCDAKASNGEICCSKKDDGRCDYLAHGDCTEGLEEYKSGYVDPFAAVLGEYEGKVRVVVVLEPDGLANLATNIANPACGNLATQTAYKSGVKYAVEQITRKAPSVAIYLDAAHGGWLGWANNMGEFMEMLRGLELPYGSIRGFATNVANYQALGIQCPWCPDSGFRNGYCLNGKHENDPCCADPCGLLSQWNFGNNELNYAAGLVAAAREELGIEAHVIIDTGRNGVTDQRSDCANWCNPRGAGAGVPSTTHTANTSLVDAYFWLKTPGESDGCSETLPDGKQCPRYDAKCGSVDSLGTAAGEPPAVEAGMWFDYQVKQLAENAVFDPPVQESNATCPISVPPQGQPTQPSQPRPSPAGAASAANGTTGTSGACAGAYGQCGGHDWLGASCCEEGCSCVGSGGYYSQCVPKDPTLGSCGSRQAAPEESPAETTTTLGSSGGSDAATRQRGRSHTTTRPVAGAEEAPFPLPTTTEPEESGSGFGIFGPWTSLVLKDEVSKHSAASQSVTFLGTAAPWLIVTSLLASAAVLVRLAARGRCDFGAYEPIAFRRQAMRSSSLALVSPLSDLEAA